MKNKYSIPIALSIIVLSIIGNTLIDEKKKEVREKYLSGYYDNIVLQKYLPPNNWTTYEIANTFSLSVPPTMELRGGNDLYTKEIQMINYNRCKINVNSLVFQQKGLSTKNIESFRSYCRIIINIDKGNVNDYPFAADCPELSINEIRDFQKSVQNPYKYKTIGKPSVRWIKIDDIYCLEIEYLRTGEENKRTKVFIYYFFNNDKRVNIVLSYRQNDLKYWESDFSNIIRTFKWAKITKVL